ncbi:unnamed protein product [Ilex paraguariensis]|uniref:Retroviral polymerase SH3-like domain-containing protein n=1 Tax=Ilex paraguariensis TaxID=185542 RepID=A0ABC8SVA6_9AQUA
MVAILDGGGLWFMVLLILQLSKGVKGSPQVAALYVFGDSLVDDGNNNNLNSMAKANYFPYGCDFDRGATGRFSNGKTFADFLGELLGVPSPPAFADPSTVGARILGGVNYASAAAGILDETGQHYGDRYSLSEQVVNFETTLRQLRTMMSGANLTQYLAKSVAVMVFGSNDYINNYLLPALYPSSNISSPSEFANILLNAYARQIVQTSELLRQFSSKFLIIFQRRSNHLPAILQQLLTIHPQLFSHSSVAIRPAPITNLVMAATLFNSSTPVILVAATSMPSLTIDNVEAIVTKDYGYDIEHKDYRCYDPITKRLRIFRHVQFWEHKAFNSVSKFPFNTFLYSPIFTNSSIDLFPNFFDAGNVSSSGDNSMTAPHDFGSPVYLIITSDPSEYNSTTTRRESGPSVGHVISPDPPESSSTLDVHRSNRIVTRSYPSLLARLGQDFSSSMTECPVSKATEALHSVGLRKFMLAGIGPLGCIPNQLATGRAQPGQCVDYINQMLGTFNEGLRSLVNKLNNGTPPGALFLYGNTYGALGDILNSPARYGKQLFHFTRRSLFNGSISLVRKHY